MNFFQYEIRNLIKNFPHEKATLEDDFLDFELDAIKDLGVLKKASHLYLGKYR